MGRMPIISSIHMLKSFWKELGVSQQYKDQQERVKSAHPHPTGSGGAAVLRKQSLRCAQA